MYTFTNYLLYKYVGSVVCPFKVIFCGIFGVHLRAYGWLKERSPLHLQECLRTMVWTGPFKTCFDALAEILCTRIVFSQFSRKIEKKSCELEGEFPGVHRKTSLEGWKLLRFLSFVSMHSYKHSRSFLSFGSEEFLKVVPWRLPSDMATGLANAFAWGG